MQTLADPYHDRRMKNMRVPPNRPLADCLLFLPNHKIDTRLLQDFFRDEGRLSCGQVLHICHLAKESLSKEPNVLELVDPVTVVGDLHGQFYDLLNIFQRAGPPLKRQYLFLGGYINRGHFSLEVLLLLLAYKVTLPTFHLLRSNHETRQLSQQLTFLAECKAKYNIEVYQALLLVFDHLPIAALISERFLAVHGGISPELPSLASLNALPRFQEPKGALLDMLWAGPVESPPGFTFNKARGCGYSFGPDALLPFLRQNKLYTLIRGHTVQQQGTSCLYWRKSTLGLPQCLSLFSAPDYHGQGNLGAYLVIRGRRLDIYQLDKGPTAPYYLPEFLDIFQWSVPFITLKVRQMVSQLLRRVQLEKEDLSEHDLRLLEQWVHLSSLPLKGGQGFLLQSNSSLGKPPSQPSRNNSSPKKFSTHTTPSKNRHKSNTTTPSKKQPSSQVEHIKPTGMEKHRQTMFQHSFQVEDFDQQEEREEREQTEEDDRLTSQDRLTSRTMTEVQMEYQEEERRREIRMQIGTSGYSDRSHVREDSPLKNLSIVNSILKSNIEQEHKAPSKEFKEEQINQEERVSFDQQDRMAAPEERNFAQLEMEDERMLSQNRNRERMFSQEENILAMQERMSNQARKMFSQEERIASLQRKEYQEPPADTQIQKEKSFNMIDHTIQEDNRAHLLQDQKSSYLQELENKTILQQQYETQIQQEYTQTPQIEPNQFTLKSHGVHEEERSSQIDQEKQNSYQNQPNQYTIQEQAAYSPYTPAEHSNPPRRDEPKSILKSSSMPNDPLVPKQPHAKMTTFEESSDMRSLASNMPPMLQQSIEMLSSRSSKPPVNSMARPISRSKTQNPSPPTSSRKKQQPSHPSSTRQPHRTNSLKPSTLQSSQPINRKVPVKPTVPSFASSQPIKASPKKEPQEKEVYMAKKVTKYWEATISSHHKDSTTSGTLDAKRNFVQRGTKVQNARPAPKNNKFRRSVVKNLPGLEDVLKKDQKHDLSHVNPNDTISEQNSFSNSRHSSR